MAVEKDLQYYLAQARKIEEHREAGAEREIRKLYKSMLSDLKQLMADTYIEHAEDDRLSFAKLQEAGYHARFLEEVDARLNLSTPKVQKELRALVEDTYAAAYDSMVRGVAAQGIDGFDEALARSLSITPEQIRAAVENPVSGLTLTDTLEKNRKDIVYSIKQTIGIGLMNGDRYSTMAKRIVKQVDGDYRKAIRIARTEAHRVREAGNIAAALAVDDELQKGTSGLRMVKTWRTMQDERVRPQRAAYKRKDGVKPRNSKKPTAGLRSMLNGPNHVKLDGQVRLVGEKFDLGRLKDKTIEAMAPGQSGSAGHDINCRCYASESLMTDEEYFKLTGKHFPGWEEKKKAAEAKANAEAATESETAIQAEMPNIVMPATIEEVNEAGNAMMANVYEYHRVKNNLHMVPYEERLVIKGFEDIDYSRLSVESAKAFNDTFVELSAQYDVPLQRIRMMSKEEAMFSGAFAITSHNYEMDSAEILINPVKCRDYGKMTERIKELSVKGYSAKIPDEVAHKYIATHEFAHTLLNVQQPLNKNRNWVNADYGKIKKARKEIVAVHEKYMQEVKEITALQKKAEMDAMLTLDADTWKRAAELSAEVKRVKISNYSLESVDEFLAEAFTNEKLGITSNKYGRQVVDILDKYFRR